MQIEIYNPTQGELLAPVQWNYAELKKQLTEALESYKGRVYTEDDIGSAKRDRASLNKLADAIDSKRKEMKAFYLKPYEEFEAQAKELTALVKEQAAEIDAQVKAVEDARKAEKQEQIKQLYADIMGDLCELVPYDKIHNSKWLNATKPITAVSTELADQAESIRAALTSIDALGLTEDMTAQIKRVYLDKLDLAAALAEKERIEREQALLEAYEAAKKKHAEEVKAESENAQPEQQEQLGAKVYTVDFRVFATTEQLSALKAFLHDNGIKYGKVLND